jgi:cytidine deaminase
MIMIKLSGREKILLETALRAVDKAYVLWGFQVGAAVLAEDGKIYEGCNVESWVSGLGVCAERNAVNHAVSHGNRRIMEIAVVMDADSQNDPKPCGACLQYIYDFAENPNIKIVMAKVKDGKILSETVQAETLRAMLPFPYRK